MRTYNKKCKTCGCDFIGTGPAAMYCEVHRLEALKEQRERNRIKVAAARAASGQIKKPGVGKGGNPHRGAEHPSYKHGKYMFERIRYEVKEEMVCCERCEKDLTEANRWLWVVHHRDHNQYNNDRSNLELLCKRCHQIEHECHLAFTGGATTIPKGSTLK